MKLHARIALALSALAFAAPARATEFAAGDGSPDSPYVIRNAEQLAKFRDIVNGANGETGNSAACARLAADIDLAGAAWTPIGDNACRFSGTFDGHGHTIGGLSVDLQSGDYEVEAGLFGVVGEDGTVKDLGVCGDVAARGSGDYTICFAGGVAGKIFHGTVEGCFHAGSVSADSRFASWAGGIVSDNDRGTVRNCRYAGSVTSKASSTACGGGVVGDNSSRGAVRNCYAVGTVTATGDGDKFAGGVAGSNHGTMENCYYDKTVAGTIGAVNGGDTAGATGKTTAEMQGLDALSRLALNAGLDADAWTATEGYPELKSFVAYPLWIGGARFTAGNLVIDADDDPGIASGTATFDPASNTLSLTNFVYSGAGHSWTVEPGTENEHTSAACIFYSGADALAVSLSGTNSVALSAANPAPYSSYGFRSGNYKTAVSFAGSGSLSARAGAAENSSYGVDVHGPLAVAAGAEVAGAAGAAPSSGGVAAFGRIEVGGRLAGTGGASSNTSEGIACYTMGTSEVVVSEGASVAAAGGAARLSYGILAKTLTVNGGEATAEGGEATTRSRALYPTSGDVALAVADGWQVFAGEDADSAALVAGDGWKDQKYVRIGPVAYPVWVAGRQVTGANATNVLGDASASVSFAGTATNGTLTLRDASITEPFGYVPGQSNYGYIAIYTKSGSNFALTVALEGTNRVGSAEFADGFQTWSPLTITGGGVLFAVADDVAIFSYPSVLIDGATVFAEGWGSGGRGSRGWGIEASGFAATNATVQATGASVGITANGVWIGGDSTVVAEGGTAALGCYPPENFSLGDGLAVLEPAGGTPDLYVPILGRIFISSGGAAATRVVIGPPPPAVAATVTFNGGSGAATYDGQGHGVEVEVTDPAEGAAVLFALGDSSGPTDTFGPTAPMFTNVCDVTVYVEISAEGYRTATISAAVTVVPAPLAITAKDQSYVYNGQTQGEGDTLYATPGDIAEKVAVSGLAPGDGLASIILDGQGADPGTYPLVPSGATVTNAVGAYVTDNYAIGYTNGTLTIREPPPPVVSNVVARQRWPWNGLVDVDYEVGGYTTGLVARISFAKQGDEGRPRVATRFLAGTEPSAVPGRYRATWDAAADGAANFVASNLVATVALVEPDVWLLPRMYELYNGDIYLDGDKVRSADDVDTNLIVAPGDSCTCLLISSYEDANGDTRYKQIEAKPAVAVESDEKDMFTTVAGAGQVTVSVNRNTLIGSSAAISCSLAGCRMRNSLTVSTGAMRGIKLYLPEAGRPTMYDKNAWDVYARLVPFADNSREVEAGATYQKATLSNDRLDELLVQHFSYVQDGDSFLNQNMYRLEASVPSSAEKVLVLYELRAKNAADGDWGFVMPAYMIDLSKSLYEEDRNYTENDYVPYNADYFFPLWTAEFNTNQTPFGTYKGNAKTKAFKVGDGVGFHTGRMTGSEGSGQGLWTIGVSHVRPLDAAVIEGSLDDGNMKAVGTGETCLLGSWYGVEGIVYPIHFTELSTNPSTYSAEPTLLSVTE